MYIYIIIYIYILWINGYLRIFMEILNVNVDVNEYEWIFMESLNVDVDGC